MKKLVLVSAALLALSFVFPDGPMKRPPVVPLPTPAPVVPADAEIVKLLTNATQVDKARIVGVYAGLVDVVKRDGGKLLKTTEQWETLHANTLKLAVGDTALKGKYPGLDVAIEAVFESKLGKDKEVAMADEKTRGHIIEACEVVQASAR